MYHELMNPRVSSEHSARRSYRLRRRAETMDATRTRITEAALRLHTSVGPSEASLVRIADAAGVTRATLYRHFPSAEALFGACMEHWISRHPPPNPAAWVEVADFELRMRRSLGELYDWYDKHDADLYPIYRDSAFTPESNQRQRAAIVEGIASALVTGVRLPPVEMALLRGIITHFVSYPTWRSLTSDAGLSTGDATELAATCVIGIAHSLSNAD